MALDPKLQKFTTASPVVASYSYTDIAEGTGMQIFYGSNSKEESTYSYHLLGTAIASDEIETKANSTAEGNVKMLDLDFDISEFNMPRDLKGTAYISIPFMAHEASGATSAYVIAKLRKWDGSSETEIASSQSDTINPASGVLERQKLLVRIVVPSTHFKKRETLRLTLEGWGATTSGEINITIGHDPKGRITTDFPGTEDYKVTTTLEVHIPFKLDL
ncbi:hypothetical protein LCGC14_1586470 [marine sediment metagenome]|uniref:Uncharacterized protein n=1 Tax=marine sediment metagenome TaxID=412755 RepID=A0A0F9IF86_9ZZZZ